MKDERGPGLDFFVCFVWQSSVRGCHVSFVFVYFIIKVFECKKKKKKKIGPVPGYTATWSSTS